MPSDSQGPKPNILQRRSPVGDGLQNVRKLISANRIPEAVYSLDLILNQDPDCVETLCERAMLEMRKGNHSGALPYLKKAHGLEPGNTQCLAAMASAYAELQKFQPALDCYEKLLTIEPDSIQALHQSATMLLRLDRAEEAVETYRKVLGLDPNHLPTYNNMGRAYMRTRDIKGALDCFNKLIRLNPDSIHGYSNLGFVNLWRQDLSESYRCFDKAHEIFKKNQSGAEHSGQVILSRLVHDLEQVRYLIDRGIVKESDVDQRYIERLEKLLSENQASEGSASNRMIQLCREDIEALAPSFLDVLHMADGEPINGPVVNPDLDIHEVEGRYNASVPEVMYVDNLLTEEALEKLYQFCLQSTIFKKEFMGGYVGTMLNRGFASPLVLQVSEALRTTLPGIFREHLLNHAWAFKYDSRLKGINTHADLAKVTVNFWISPDEGNLNPESGGLVVWDKACPTDWPFADYNSNEPKIQKFIKESGANKITVPFKRNRAMIFNSSLFHRTDDTEFRNEYDLRRINLTLLYGSGLRI